MNWSAHVRNLNKDGYTNQQIIEECNMPFITEQFVINALRKPSSYNWVSFTEKPFTPKIPIRKKIQAYFETHSIKEFDTIPSHVLGERIGVSGQAIRNYKRQVIRGKNQPPKYLGIYRHYEKRLIAEGRMKIPEKQKTVQDIKNLW